MYKELKVLIAYDSIMTFQIVQKVITETLKGIADVIDFRSYEVKPDDTPPNLPQGATHLTCGNPQDLIDRISEIDILLVQFAPVSAEVIEAASNLKAIGVVRTGPDNVDVSAATKRGIPIFYALGRNSVSVAEITIGLILSEVKNIGRADSWLRSGAWKRMMHSGSSLRVFQEAHKMFEGSELAGKTLGIVGFGAIGKQVAIRAKAFDMNINTFDPYVSKEAIEEAGVRCCDLETLMRESDVVTLHVRLKPGTKHIIGKKELSLMKRTAYLINTSDGPVVDQQALYEALRNRMIAGVAEEGPKGLDDPLIGLTNVTHTPALGGAAKEIPERGIRIVTENIARYLKGEKPKIVLNPEVLKT